MPLKKKGSPVCEFTILGTVVIFLCKLLRAHSGQRQTIQQSQSNPHVIVYLDDQNVSNCVPQNPRVSHNYHIGHLRECQGN